MSSKFSTGLFAAALPFAAAAAPESFTIDAYHSFPYFDTVHLGTSVIRGRFEKISGKLVLDTAAKTGTIELTVPTATLSTGDNDKGSRPRSRDEHLRSPDFFNVAEFPTMSYKGTATKWHGDAPATVEGQLTLLGVTRPVRSEEHTSELQSPCNLVCRLLLEKKKRRPEKCTRIRRPAPRY